MYWLAICTNHQPLYMLWFVPVQGLGPTVCTIESLGRIEPTASISRLPSPVRFRHCLPGVAR